MVAMRVVVPIGNQRTQVGNDGRAPEDGNMDCVPEALACMARGLTPALTGKLTGDGLHDAVYGQGYVGLQDPALFVGVLAQQYGMRLMGPVTGTAQALYGRAVAETSRGGRCCCLSPATGITTRRTRPTRTWWRAATSAGTGRRSRR